MNAEELFAKARALVPALQARAEAGDKLRMLPEETVKDFVREGLFRILVPERFGGYQLDFVVLVDICKEVARGCGSSAWCLGILCAHNWLAALFEERAQTEVFGNSGFALLPSAFNPAHAKANRCASGYRLSGNWQFASGVDYSSWAVVASFIEKTGKDQILEERAFLVPRKDFTILDDWHVLGMRATGSKQIVINDALVPEYRTADVEELFSGRAPGAALHMAPLYRVPLVSAITMAATAPAIGIARDGFATYRESVQTRTRAFSGGKQIEKAASHIRLAESAAALDAAEIMLDRDVRQLTRAAEAGEHFSLEARARYRMDFAYIVKNCRLAVDILVEVSGAKGIFESSRLERAFRDIHTLSSHHVFDVDEAGELYGRVLLGLSPSTPLY